MSLIDFLNDDSVWDNYLQTKTISETLPKKIIDEYTKYITSRKYKKIANKIVNSEYTFSIPRKVEIGKTGKNKKRSVYIFEEDENYILKVLSFLLYKYDYLFSPNLYSFRKNSGVKKAIYDITKTKNISKMYGYKVDISNYFNSIPVHKLLNSLKKDLNDNKLYEFIENIIFNNKVIYKNEIIYEEKGIMAGIPISSFLANYYLKDLDHFFYDHSILYARYADDIIVFSNDSQKIEEYKNYICSYLNKNGLEINKSKEFFYEPGDKFEFLGFSYQGGIIDISNNSYKKIQGKIKRTARGLRRWMIKKKSTPEVTLKAMNRKFNRKFYGKNENDLTWKYWFFPIINTSDTLNKIDKYMQDEQRYIVTGVHNKKNYEKVPYEFLKKCNYRPLVNEFYKTKK
ncbi:MAG: group II intron reverse transcriptase domain-containing protein [Clostridia bacterium]|nr:group II intron reverse transcriptase domain-containing protein [Clostridia bacterium]